MTITPSVSIIMPVYNVEAYLTECLDSVVNQTFHDMEIILVNDGSTDSSPEIIKVYAEKDKRIKIITQPNSGVSAARNAGIRVASGHYILFVDSDDTIIPDSVETLYHKTCETGSDLLLGNAIWCYPEDGRQDVVLKRNEELNSLIGISGEECYIKLMKERDTFPPLVYLFFIKRDLIIRNKLFFKVGIIHEDVLWCIQAMLSAKRVALIDFNYYYYRQREGSLTNLKNKEYSINSLIVVNKEIKKMIQKFRKAGKPEELIYSLYIQLVGLSRYIHNLQMEINENAEETFLNSRFFSNLFLDIYPKLSYKQQKEYLISYCY